MEQPTIGQPCRVHYNLRTGKWSVSIMVDHGNGKRWWNVRGNYDAVTIRNAVPRVNLSGVQKIRDRQRRKVVAQVDGVLVSINQAEKSYSSSRMVRVHYNPHRHDLFHTNPTNPVPWHGANLATFTSDGAMWASQ